MNETKTAPYPYLKYVIDNSSVLDFKRRRAQTELDQLTARLAAAEAERDALKAAYHNLWTKHGDLAEQTVSEVLKEARAALAADG